MLKDMKARSSKRHKLLPCFKCLFEVPHVKLPSYKIKTSGGRNYLWIHGNMLKKVNLNVPSNETHANECELPGVESDPDYELLTEYILTSAGTDTELSQNQSD